MTGFPEWIRLYQAITFLAYGSRRLDLDIQAYPGASVGLSFAYACVYHPAWEGGREIPWWMQKALIIFGRSHSWELDAPSLRKRLQALKRKIHRREANRERDGWHAQAVFDEVTTRRHELITTLGNGLITSYGLIGAGEKDTGALAIPSELYRSPLRLTPEGDICCGLGKAELILWRDVVVRYADIDRLWPEDGNPKDQSASQKQRVAVPKQPVSKTDATRRSSRDDQRASKALAAMKSIQEEAIAARGKPLDIRSLGRELKSRFYFPSRLADQLSPMLSDTHKNRRRG